MIKNYIYALALSCAATVAFAQKDVKIAKLKTGTTVIVDGVADAVYSDALNIPMQSIANCMAGVTDCGLTTPATNCKNVAKWTAVYNEEAIYIFASVVDNNKVAGDKIELFFSMDNDRTSNCPGNWPRAYNANTFQLELNGSAQGAVVPASPNGMVGAIESVKSVVTATGYDVEVKMIFSEMDFLSGKLPVAGRKIGFDIANNDALVGEEKAQSMWNACCVNRNWTESTSFGTLTLGDQEVAGVTSTNNLTSLVNKMTVYPNPAAGKVNLRISAVANDNVNIALVNSLSQKMYTSNQTLAAGETTHEINTENLANGIYTVVISKGNLNTTEMVVINK